MTESAKVLRTVPVVAMRNSVIFPRTDPLLSFGRPKSIAAVNAAFGGDRVLAIFCQKDSQVVEPSPQDIYKVGTIATITQMMSTENEIHAVVRGKARVELVEGFENGQFLVGRVSELPERDFKGDEVVALSRKLAKLFKKSVNLGKGVEVTTIMKILSAQVDPAEVVDSVASLLDLKIADKQKVLEILSVKDRLKKVIDYLVREVNVLDLERKISTKTHKRFEEQMRRAMLREKKKTIEEELGEEDGGIARDDVGEFKKKIKAAKMPKNVHQKALKELKRLSKLSPYNPEGGYIRNYLEWLIEMPWSKASLERVSIKKAEKILDQDHYGLEKAKERILEYLAVMQLKKAKPKKSARGRSSAGRNNNHPTILCFVGPPGVGKTSIGKSIAKALGREFVRISLGGIRDEAEIRGHRRTYVGALPGRIIQGIKNAGTKNPVFMLDEIDKVGADFRGDPSSALLEALDPEQNKEFSDHYLEVAFDLSEVMFICTANVLDTIPVPLLDRMETINFPGYIEDEKFHIADRYLWPKQVSLHSLDNKRISLEDRALTKIIRRYTKEAGVRSLERTLATVCRKLARLVAEKKKYSKKISSIDIKKYLGPAKFTSQIAEKKDEVGMATGLAVTPTGGEILFIEVALMPGKGKLTLTGQLGDVMKESAKAAFTWSKSHWMDLGLREGFGKSIDVHIHVPEGAVQKDGPSAGIALATALVSALTGVSVKRDVGMTGEVTLRGRVLEIGGVKEKVIAAHRAGLKKIILPKDNKKDMVDIPKNVKKDIKFLFAGELPEVLGIAMSRWPLVKSSKKLKAIPNHAFIAAN